MSVTSRVIRRYRSAGLSGVVDSSRARLAGWIAPREPVEVGSAVPPAEAGPLSAADVTHAESLEWFQHRRENYVGLARALEPYLPKDGVLFDVGANVGFFTKVICEELSFSGQVHLFEPVPHLASLCRETISMLEAPTALHSFGLGDANDVVDIFLASDGNLGWNTMVADKATERMRRVSVEVRRFDDSGILATPDVVKIDVEGAEYRVLRGMMDALERWSPKPVILCEIGWGNRHPDWAAELEVFESLCSLGYEPRSLAGDRIDLADLTSTTDVLFLPTDR